MADYAEIVRLMAAMEEHGITELKLREGEMRLRLGRQPAAVAAAAAAPSPAAPAPAAPAQAAEEAGEAAETAEPAPGHIVTAPVVGVYYAAPSPEADPFTAVGRRVSQGDVLCIIEAMKLMNEVTSTGAGEVAEVYVHNGDKVEYGQPLFRII